MDASPEFELHTERWCAGLRFVAMRPLQSVERALLEGRTQALTRRFWTAVACVPVGVAVPLAAAMLVPRTLGVPRLDAVVALLVIAAACAAPTVFVLRAHDAWRDRRCHRADLATGELLRFEGILETRDESDEEQSQLLALGLLVPESGTGQALEVLPVSNLVILRSPDRPVRYVRVNVTEVAAGPAYSMRVEVPRGVAYIEGSPEVRFLRRTLNAHECAELAAHIHRLRRPKLGMGLWGVWFGAWAIAMLVSPAGVARYAVERWPLVLVQIVALLVFLVTYLRALGLAAGLERDTTTGWAFTLHRAAADPTGEDLDLAFEPPPVPDPRQCVEFLPHSRALWNERGRPARWRNLRRAA